jgi:hypothetical protein
MDRRRGHIGELRKRVAEAEAKPKRLYEAIENGVINAADPSLKDRIPELSAIRDQAHADAERAAAALERLGPAITPESLRRFALSARRKLRNEGGTYRQDHLRAVAQRVGVVSPSEIRILGTKTELLRTLVAAAGVETAAAGVRSLYRNGAPDTIRTCGLRLRRATLYPAELRVLTAYAVLTRISRMSGPQRAALASHCSTILFLPHFSHEPA